MKTMKDVQSSPYTLAQYELHMAPNETIINSEGIISTHHFTVITVELWDDEGQYLESVKIQDLVKAYKDSKNK